MDSRDGVRSVHSDIHHDVHHITHSYRFRLPRLWGPLSGADRVRCGRDGGQQTQLAIQQRLLKADHPEGGATGWRGVVGVGGGHEREQPGEQGGVAG